MEAIAGIAVVLFILALYLFPALIAGLRKHHQFGAILVLNLTLGWTGFGWLAALIWASTSSVREYRIAIR